MTAKIRTVTDILTECNLAAGAKAIAWRSWVELENVGALRSALEGLGVPPGAIEELVALKGADEVSRAGAEKGSEARREATIAGREQEVLAAILADSQNLVPAVKGKLYPEDFAVDHHAALFAVFLELAAEGRLKCNGAVPSELIEKRLADRGQQGALELLYALRNTPPSPYDISDAVRDVKWYSIGRYLHEVLNEAAGAYLNPFTPFRSCVAYLAKQVEYLQGQMPSKPSSADVVPDDDHVKAMLARAATGRCDA
jgi:hypothetical protein